MAESSWKLRKLYHCIKEVMLPYSQIIDQYLSYLYSPKCLKESCIFDLLNTSTQIRSCTHFSLDLEKNHSAAMALILLADRISKALENGDSVIGLFLDFSKAFNTINYHILFAKLYHYGIRVCLLDWFKSYLTDRKQYVYYNGYSSSTQTVTCGVPQGSILGPLLFLIYVNDLATVSEHIFSILFADDTNMFMCGKNVQLLEEIFLMQKWERFLNWFKYINSHWT